LDLFGAEYGPVAGYYEHGNETFDSIKCEGFETSTIRLPRSLLLSAETLNDLNMLTEEG
jgi:hypothetical protein